MKKILLVLLSLLCMTVCGYAGVTISGPTQFCPNQTYTFTVNNTYLIECGLTWGITNSSGTQIAYGASSTITFDFPPRAGEVYTISAGAAAGIYIVKIQQGLTVNKEKLIIGN